MSVKTARGIFCTSLSPPLPFPPSFPPFSLSLHFPPLSFPFPPLSLPFPPLSLPFQSPHTSLLSHIPLPPLPLVGAIGAAAVGLPRGPSYRTNTLLSSFVHQYHTLRSLFTIFPRQFDIFHSKFELSADCIQWVSLSSHFQRRFYFYHNFRMEKTVSIRLHEDS